MPEFSDFGAWFSGCIRVTKLLGRYKIMHQKQQTPAITSMWDLIAYERLSKQMHLLDSGQGIYVRLPNRKIMGLFQRPNATRTDTNLKDP